MGKVSELQISNLTKGEKFFLNRKREGSTQHDAAKAEGVPVVVVRGWERNSNEFTDLIPAVALGMLQLHEKFMILRRRRGTSLKDFADELGMSRAWVIKMERGDAPQHLLNAYWGG